MDDKAVKEWLGECLRKKKYRTEERPERIIRKAKKRGLTLYMYHCRHCQNFHLSKLPGRYEDLKKAS